MSSLEWVVDGNMRTRSGCIFSFGQRITMRQSDKQTFFSIMHFSNSNNLLYGLVSNCNECLQLIKSELYPTVCLISITITNNALYYIYLYKNNMCYSLVRVRFTLCSQIETHLTRARGVYQRESTSHSRGSFPSRHPSLVCVTRARHSSAQHVSKWEAEEMNCSHFSSYSSPSSALLVNFQVSEAGVCWQVVVASRPVREG